MSKLFAPARMPASASFGLSLARAYFGVVFAIHGWPKVTHENGPTAYLENTQFSGWMLAAAAIIEFLGGALLAIGLATRLVALLLAGVMVGAINFHIGRGDPFIGGWEMATSYLVVMLLFVLAGPGKLSADQKMFGRKSSTM